MEFELEESESKGRVYISPETGEHAEMSFSKAGNALIIIDHTEVSEGLRGMGVGNLLLGRLVTLAREKNVQILPLCPFARSVFAKDSTIRDVLKG